jgi:hypothetical protein
VRVLFMTIIPLSYYDNPSVCSVPVPPVPMQDPCGPTDVPPVTLAIVA